MTAIRPGLPPMPQTAAQAGASARAAQVRAQFFQAMQAQPTTAQPAAVQQPVQAQATAQTMRVQPTAMSQPAVTPTANAAGANEVSPPVMRRPGSLLNILV